MPRSQPCDSRIDVRLPSSYRDILETAAEQYGLSISEIVRRMVMADIDDAVLEAACPGGD